jgi:hypothetical protein
MKDAKGHGSNARGAPTGDPSKEAPDTRAVPGHGITSRSTVVARHAYRHAPGTTPARGGGGGGGGSGQGGGGGGGHMGHGNSGAKLRKKQQQNDFVNPTAPKSAATQAGLYYARKANRTGRTP